MENTNGNNFPAPGMGYPQNTGYPQNNGYPQPYYPQPGYGHPCPSPANYQSPPQQQQQVFIVGNQPVAPQFVIGAPSLSMTGAIALSCFVFWCCGWLFGLIAFILAMVGQSSAAAGDSNSAIQLRNASYGLSIVGIVAGIIVIAVVAGMLGSAANNLTNVCFNYDTNQYYSC